MYKIPQSGERFLEGQILLINKPFGWSSFAVVKKIRYLIKKKYNLKKIKVGHAGTLDPLATGLLIICTGKFTKKITAIQDAKKVYEGEITFGGSTLSYDLETKVTCLKPTNHITLDLVKKTATNFVGDIAQKPPAFSALKKDGERLYKKARRGEKIDIKSRKVNVDYFNIIKFNNPKLTFGIKCSKGTYIRSIANDFGKKLNSGAYLSKLCRTAIGDYKLTKSINLEDFENELNTSF